MPKPMKDRQIGWTRMSSPPLGSGCGTARGGAYLVRQEGQNVCLYDGSRVASRKDLTIGVSLPHGVVLLEAHGLMPTR
jgi:hypothetical protein